MKNRHRPLDDACFFYSLFVIFSDDSYAGFQQKIQITCLLNVLDNFV